MFGLNGQGHDNLLQILKYPVIVLFFLLMNHHLELIYSNITNYTSVGGFITNSFNQVKSNIHFRYTMYSQIPTNCISNFGLY